MNKRIDTLIDCLSRKESLLENLVLLMNKERNMIAVLDAAGLEEGKEEKVHLITLLEQCKTSCKKALDDVADAFDLPSADNLSDIIRAADPHQGQALGKLQRRLTDLVHNLSRINRFNASLLQGSLRMVNRSLEFYGSCFGSAGTYSGSGMIVSGVPDGRLVSGEI
jgi:flagellar biosynthesis/type III secretory pathway chaperone